MRSGINKSEKLDMIIKKLKNFVPKNLDFQKQPQILCEQDIA